jgi:hypothetical protein
LTLAVFLTVAAVFARLDDLRWVSWVFILCGFVVALTSQMGM